MNIGTFVVFASGTVLIMLGFLLYYVLFIKPENEAKNKKTS